MDHIQKEQFLLILEKYERGNATPEEVEFLEAYYKAFSLRSSYTSGLNEKELGDLKNELLNRINQNTVDKQVLPMPSPQRKLWTRVVAAASIVAVLSVGLYYFKGKERPLNADKFAYNNDILPGKQGATLTLSGGKKIKLTNAANGELAKESGVVITKYANGQLVYEIKSSETEPNKINTLSTAKGETYQLRLPDGSLVWLNAASSLTYSANLNERGKRRVRLDGEGYFEIAKDKTHPFVVESKGQDIEVLGTHFNVQAYTDETNTKTTLLEGSVRITAGGTSKVLKPDQQSILKGNTLKVNQVSSEDAIAWKDGLFVFEDEPLEQIMRRIERWYNVEVVYGDGVNKTKQYWGSVSRYEQVSSVLDVLQSTKNIHFKIEGRRILVMK
jgi:ferric-dicitrate binding protein FerR (iron transport regulator)